MHPVGKSSLVMPNYLRQIADKVGNDEVVRARQANELASAEEKLYGAAL